MMLVVPSEKKYEQYIMNFIKIAEKLKNKINFGICIMKKTNCKEFLYRIRKSKFKNNFKKKKNPFIFIMETSTESNDHFIYFYQENKNKIVYKYMKKFIKNYLNKKLSPVKFSQRIPTYDTPKKLQKVVQKTIDFFFLNGVDKDLIILFYDSRDCIQKCNERSSKKWLCRKSKILKKKSKMCKKVLRKFQKLVEQVSNNPSIDPNRIRYGYFDIGKNSFDILKIKTRTPFIRIYKNGDKEEIIEKQISPRLETFTDEISYFVLKSLNHNYDKKMEIDDL